MLLLTLDKCYLHEIRSFALAKINPMIFCGDFRVEIGDAGDYLAYEITYETE